MTFEMAIVGVENKSRKKEWERCCREKECSKGYLNIYRLITSLSRLQHFLQMSLRGRIAVFEEGMNSLSLRA
jgi:hypothetical protein